VNQSPRLIWVQDDNDKISFAPWLLGSTIFYKQTDDIKTIFRTFEQYPIDTFCASQNDYEMLDQQEQRKNNTQLQQLLSTEPIVDAMIKFRWYSLTNLHIQDSESSNYSCFIIHPLLILDCAAISADLNRNSDVQTVLKSYITTFKYKQFENIYGIDQHRIQVQL
jgi:hypothetical protein